MKEKVTTYKEVYDWCLNDDECMSAIFLVSIDDIDKLVSNRVELDPPRERLFKYLSKEKTPKNKEEILRITLSRLIGRFAAVSSALYNFDLVQEY